MHKIVTWHGENDTLFYIVRECGTEWEHVATFHTREEAEAYLDHLDNKSLAVALKVFLDRRNEGV